MRRRIRAALRFVTGIVQHVPSKEDSKLQTIVKLISIGDKLYSLNAYNVIDDFAKERKLLKTNNGVLVDLLFSSKLLDDFTSNDIKLEDYGYHSISILELKHPVLGSLYFVERRYNSGEAYKDVLILHKENFDFQKLMDMFWESYEGKLYITFTLDGQFVCSEFPAEKLQIYGKNAELARDLAIQHLKYVAANIPRSYLFLGTPGTGKSSCAMLFSAKIGQHILKIEANALVQAGKSLRFLLNALKPDFVLIDDIDKDKAVGENMSSVLSSIEWIKISNPDVTIVFTANDINTLDKAFWRPGRVDSITIFEEPSREDRLAIIKGFIEQFKVVLPDSYSIERVVDETVGMSPVWLREIILRFKYDNPENIISVCRQMHNIVSQPDNNDDDEVAPKSPSKTNGRSAKARIKKNGKT